MIIISVWMLIIRVWVKSFYEDTTIVLESLEVPYYLFKICVKIPLKSNRDEGETRACYFMHDAF